MIHQYKLSGFNIVLYYPTRGESLWSVAKKYNTTEEKLSAANGGAKDPLDGSVLMIPSEKTHFPAKKTSKAR